MSEWVCVDEPLAGGYDPRDFNPSEKSEYLLLIQAAETLETFFVLWLLLRKFKPQLDADDDWFNFDFKSDAFSIEKGWFTWGQGRSVGRPFSLVSAATQL